MKNNPKKMKTMSLTKMKVMNQIKLRRLMLLKKIINLIKMKSQNMNFNHLKKKKRMTMSHLKINLIKK